MQKTLVSWLMVAYLLILFGLTLGGFYNPGAPSNLVPFRSIEHDLRRGGAELVVNFVGNVVAFFPMGWAIPVLLGQRFAAWKVGLLSLALSATIEVLQGFSGMRVADVDDVILNTLGGLMGLAIGRGISWVRRRSSGTLGGDSEVDPVGDGCRQPPRPEG